MKLQTSFTIWLTGLSGSGKTTIASSFDRHLKSIGIKSVVLDGDVLRNGISADLDFSEASRSENIRRTAEIAKLFNQEGVIVIAALISPMRVDRRRAESIITAPRFKEVYINTPLNICEARDPKGLYKKARNGQIKNFTGIDAPYEPPMKAMLEIDSEKETEAEIIQSLMSMIKKNV